MNEPWMAIGNASSERMASEEKRDSEKELK
jgi:hypothetical protein